MVKEVKPIPKELLVDTVTYLAVGNKDSWGAETVVSTELSQVLVQPRSSIQRGQQNESNSYELLLFFDCVNSLPVDHQFKVDDKISYLGKEYRIASVEVLKAFDQSPHHYEVMLE
ncbi:Minor capsid protein [Streptococcus equi subsp. equi]|uniref:putative minor capsid protein n=2 Tax=Streptococcus equi TaxID=1336 RepID=UPI0006593A46|nr:putative minor capsid protein [Streptococcus equi]ASB95825.1 Minor capsid protein [Streptococcus equi subsp. equi]ASB96455.1 Minor capsid protein [Streptococcus equi subsp. equi]ASB96473.1 Minor capsid protein [Streptococcus equi subsp. equi]MBT1197829.1 hypothetical protein [Streptococcus equi subsp. equi]MBT1198762.1 hypothetical protein [Streptococcus equi subsp. equi]